MAKSLDNISPKTSSAASSPVVLHKKGGSDVGTVSTTPFSLANDDGDHVFDKGNSLNSNNNNGSDGLMSDSISMTEGIDVVTAAPTPETFLDWSRLTSGRIVRSRIFKRTVLLGILINSILMGVATMDRVQEQPRLATFIDATIHAFRLVFTAEICLDILHYQRDAARQGWIIFDILVIGLSWFVSISVLVFRSFRLIRAFRKAGLGELHHLVKALMHVVPKMLAVVFLLLLVFYIFSVIFTDLYQETSKILYDNQETQYDYFGRLDKSAFTLFQVMTLDGWADIAREIMLVYPWSSVLFIVFIVLVTFFFGSLVIAVMGEAFTAVSNQRILKALEADHSLTEKKSETQQEELARLEKRIEDLNGTLESVLLSQNALQETLKQLVREKR